MIFSDINFGLDDACSAEMFKNRLLEILNPKLGWQSPNSLCYSLSQELGGRLLHLQRQSTVFVYYCPKRAKEYLIEKNMHE